MANDGAIAVNLLLLHSRFETLENTSHFLKLRLVLLLVCQHCAGIPNGWDRSGGRPSQSDVLDVALCLQEQLNQHRTLRGYKFMHLKCIQSGLVVTQKTVPVPLDPQGSHLVITRSSPIITRRGASFFFFIQRMQCSSVEGKFKIKNKIMSVDPAGE